jgi:hypothetical protein
VEVSEWLGTATGKGLIGNDNAEDAEIVDKLF